MKKVLVIWGALMFPGVCFCGEPLNQTIIQEKEDESTSKIEELASLVGVSVLNDDSNRDPYARKKLRAILNCACNFGSEPLKQKADQLRRKYGFRLNPLTLPVSFSDEEMLVWKIQKCFDGIRKINSENVLYPKAVKVFTHVDGCRLRNDSAFGFLVRVLRWIRSVEGEEGALASRALAFIEEKTTLALQDVGGSLSCNFKQLAKKDEVEAFFKNRIKLVHQEDRMEGAE